jgi:hypothetical protein
VLSKVGVTPETLWPYDVKEFDRTTSAVALATAAQRLRVSYHSVGNTPGIVKSVLAKKRPIVFGMSVFDSTVDALDGDGIIPPAGALDWPIGGHAMLIEDYDDVAFDEPMYLGANSWGTDVGLGSRPENLPPWYRPYANELRGYFAIPQRMFHDRDVADDFWTLDAAA